MDTTVPDAGPAASTRRLAAPIAALRDVTTLLLIAGLLAGGAMAVWVGRPLYADGAFYLFALLNDPSVTAWAWTRDGANVITQVPVILAMRAGVSDIAWLARIYGAALYAPPLLAYAATTWLSRRDPHLFVGNAVFVVACFLPISIFIIGEFQILYALFWCAFVLLITGNADRPPGSAIVLALAFGMADTYAISVLLCPLAMLAALWRINVTDSRPARRILILAMVPLAAGTVIGALGILVTRDPGNEGQFLQALLRSHRNVTLLGLCGLLGLTAVAAFLKGSSRRAAAAAIAVACLLFGWELTRLNHGPAGTDTYTVLGDLVQRTRPDRADRSGRRRGLPVRRVADGPHRGRATLAVRVLAIAAARADRRRARPICQLRLAQLSAAVLHRARR